MSADRPPPAFSIVVPIAPGRMPLVLESLRCLDAPAGYEVLTEVGPNPSRNRNAGIARARAAVLAFTDDDCEVSRDWLARAAAFFEAHPEFDAVGGPQLNSDDDGPVGRAGGHALASWFGTFRLRRRWRRAPLDLTATQWDLTAANLFVTRRAFERWGPFEERLWPNEETALLHRIEAAGGRIAYDPTIVVRHKRRESLHGFARQCFGYGRGRARQCHLEGAWPLAIEQSMPAAFLLYLALLPLLTAWSAAALAPLGVWAALALAASATAAVTHADPAAAAAMPFAFAAMHVAYPAGFVVEAVRLRLAPRAAAARRALAAASRRAVAS